MILGNATRIAIAIRCAMKRGKRDDILNISRNMRLPIEQAWREHLSSASIPTTSVDDIVFMTFNVIHGYALRTLWDEDSERYKRMIFIWKQMIGLLCAQHDASPLY